PFDALDPQDTCNALRSVSPSGRTPLDKIALLPPRSQPLSHTWRSILDARLRQASTASRRWAMPPIVETSFHSARANSRLPDSRLLRPPIRWDTGISERLKGLGARIEKDTGYYGKGKAFSRLWPSRAASPPFSSAGRSRC